MMCRFFYDNAEKQKQVFERQLTIAVELNKPIVIHCRDAEADCIEIVSQVIIEFQRRYIVTLLTPVN